MCTGIRIISDDGKVFIARTLEFGMNVNYYNYEDDKIKGVKGFIKDKDDSYFIDGINKNGLVAMAFYFPKYIEYSNEIKKNYANLHSLQVVEFLLLNCKNIDDVKNISKKLNILNVVYKPVGFVFPLHWFVSDKFGNCVVIECVKGNCVVYENDLGIMTNSPTFPEHLKSISLSGIQSLSPNNNRKKELIQARGIDIDLKDNYSAGTGLIGLPGDYSSISRFIRLYVLQKYSNTPKNFQEGLMQCFHILNNFDIVKGTVIKEGNDEYTQYTVVYNSDNMEVYFKTYENQIISRF
jgi:penicillin V acylase-like amidase (Ntn superfamily)